VPDAVVPPLRAARVIGPGYHRIGNAWLS